MIEPPRKKARRDRVRYRTPAVNRSQTVNYENNNNSNPVRAANRRRLQSRPTQALVPLDTNLHSTLGAPQQPKLCPAPARIPSIPRFTFTAHISDLPFIGQLANPERPCLSLARAELRQEQTLASMAHLPASIASAGPPLEVSGRLLNDFITSHVSSSTTVHQSQEASCSRL